MLLLMTFNQQNDKMVTTGFPLLQSFRVYYGWKSHRCCSGVERLIEHLWNPSWRKPRKSMQRKQKSMSLKLRLISVYIFHQHQVVMMLMAFTGIFQTTEFFLFLYRKLFLFSFLQKWWWTRPWSLLTQAVIDRPDINSDIDSVLGHLIMLEI